MFKENDNIKSRLYVCRDIIADDCGPVFQAKNDAVALRSFRQLTKDTVNPDEYELHCVGYIDQNDQFTIIAEHYQVNTIISKPDKEVVVNE